MSDALVARGIAAVIATGLIGMVAWPLWSQSRQPAGGANFARGNGRLEAKEIDVAAKFAGKLATVTVREGDEVCAGQELARIDTPVLEAQLRQAQAARDATLEAVHTAQQQVQLRQLTAEFAQRDMQRVERLAERRLASAQLLDQRRTDWQSAVRELDTARGQQRQRVAQLTEAGQQIAVIAAQLLDARLTAPRDARVLYRLAEPGEVLKEGGKVLTLIDLNDVYMYVFLSEQQAGRLAIGARAEIRLDAWPDRPLAGHVAFVSPQAQFTPKQVETTEERQKLVFRVKVQVDSAAIDQHRAWLQPGTPGVALIDTAADAPWAR